MYKYRPGSSEAIANFCECPVLDNSHGKGIYGGVVKDEFGQPLYWISETCPLHKPGGEDNGKSK